ncbi:DNA-binding IclR family transcriptional regulator [Actinoalloteichus hoggarensis]|uniref:Glycerol operon regulatory protein n=1 Tax=Actinoalloteichus hoggarensis TaxID=1470176 RepID=A0A221VY01_9PSEU|nr:IclR family transcriptional regulator [Actinoalloteichus hoggarensis]ASO18395.1 Transcriptional regulator KdgR [Actinoalloteichus hoggarensis]MBB5921759.1 DNA-binding IclR family transcriptional regulator [Actinoalloteichus hoggarensis]
MARHVPAVMRAADILELFLGERSTLSAPEIASRLGLPRSTVHELVTTLVARGYLDRRPGAETQYKLGFRLLELGARYQQDLDLATEGDAVARRIARECDETVHVAVLDGLEVVYICKIDSTHSVRMISGVGRRLPAHCTAVGKVLLAGLPPEEADALLRGHELHPLTPRSITSAAALRAQLSEVRRTGVAYEMCESNPDVGCVAAPVTDHAGVWVAALSISVPTVRHREEAWPEWERLVRDGATELSRRLGSTVR